MAEKLSYDAIVVGAGPNGLSAAIVLASAGKSVLVLEAKETVGGGARSAELTLPGFIHDTCSAIHPMAVASPYLRTLPLEKHGLKWIHPPLALAHPFDDGTAAVLDRSVDKTAESLGSDAAAYRRLMEPWLDRWPRLAPELLEPLHFPRHPLWLSRFGMMAIRSAKGFVESRFRGEKAKGLFAGLAAHSFLPLEKPPSAAIGLVLGLAGHTVGWPFPEGGSSQLSEALASYLRSLGGEIRTSAAVRSYRELPSSKVVLFDLIPSRLVEIAGERLPSSYVRSLSKFRYGPGCFKIDWALSAPVPWRAEGCRRAATVHLGGTFDELAASERAPWVGAHCEKPYVLLAQPSLFDPTRAPSGKQTLWAYCHVPRGSTVDMTRQIEAQIERFAPGFRDTVLSRRLSFPADLEKQNANLVGGDISGGIADFRQVFFRPVIRANPYAIPVKGWFLCSASTPPGTGVHGMCGFHAAKRALSAF